MAGGYAWGVAAWQGRGSAPLRHGARRQRAPHRHTATFGRTLPARLRPPLAQPCRRHHGESPIGGAGARPGAVQHGERAGAAARRAAAAVLVARPATPRAPGCTCTPEANLTLVIVDMSDMVPRGPPPGRRSPWQVSRGFGQWCCSAAARKAAGAVQSLCTVIHARFRLWGAPSSCPCTLLRLLPPCSAPREAHREQPEVLSPVTAGRPRA